MQQTANVVWKEIDLNDDNKTSLAEIAASCKQNRMRGTTALQRLDKLDRYAVDLFDFSCTPCGDRKPGKEFVKHFDRWKDSDRHCDIKAPTSASSEL